MTTTNTFSSLPLHLPGKTLLACKSDAPESELLQSESDVKSQSEVKSQSQSEVKSQSQLKPEFNKERRERCQFEYVYFIYQKSCVTGKIIENQCKVGHTWNRKVRLAGLQTGNPNKLFVYAYFKTSNSFEWEYFLKKYLGNEYVLNGEWFDIHSSRIDEILHYTCGLRRNIEEDIVPPMCYLQFMKNSKSHKYRLPNNNGVGHCSTYSDCKECSDIYDKYEYYYAMVDENF